MALETPLRFYNTLSRQKENFAPLQPPTVGLYSCGPTVYNYAHIGNLRSYVFSDTLRRVLEFNGYQVKQVINITDVDDKTIKASQNAGEALGQFTRRYEEFFLRDLDALNIKQPRILPRATEHIPEMVALVEKLLERGVAYAAEDGIYFKIGEAKNYGALAQLDRSQPTRSRLATDEYDKAGAGDFALWKFHKPEDGAVAWAAPFGRGRPGWHIECSAMSMKYLGKSFDLHTGGVDLVFPHHTNEIAQSEAAMGQPFVKYWLHSGFVNVDEQKMAKSLGNTWRLADLVREGISPLAYRLWLLMAHYRTTVNFTFEAARAAETALARLKERLVSLPDGGPVNEGLRQEFLDSINDDLNTPRALALIPSAVADSSSRLFPAEEKATWLEFDKVLGLRLGEAPTPEIVPEAVEKLAATREAARQAQDWPRADQLRAQIVAAGYNVLDTATGPKIRKTK